MINEYNRPIVILVSTPVIDSESRQVSYTYAAGNRLDAAIDETGAGKPMDGNAERGNADVTIRIRGEMHVVKMSDKVRDHDGQEYSVDGVNRDRSTRETILTCTRIDAETDPGA